MTNFDFLKDDPQFSGFADARLLRRGFLRPPLCWTAAVPWNLQSNGCIRWTAPSSSRGMISSSA